VPDEVLPERVRNYIKDSRYETMSVSYEREAIIAEGIKEQK
jgi:hypothetical protein